MSDKEQRKVTIVGTVDSIVSGEHRLMIYAHLDALVSVDDVVIPSKPERSIMRVTYDDGTSVALPSAVHIEVPWHVSMTRI